MPKIRVEAEPINVSIYDLVRQSGGWCIDQAQFTMPKIPKKGETVTDNEKVTDQLTQPVKVRGNHTDQHGSHNHLKLTRFNDFTVMVPVIINFDPTETEEPSREKIS
jgi:hypothetical protein